MDDIKLIEYYTKELENQIRRYFCDKITEIESEYIKYATSQLRISLDWYLAGDDPQGHRFVENIEDVILGILSKSFPCLNKKQFTESVCHGCEIEFICWSSYSFNYTSQGEKVKWVIGQINEEIEYKNMFDNPDLIPVVPRRELNKRKRELSKIIGVNVK
ncbi:hypothetical protein ACFLXA_03510 [Chloroflexota bacterium]